MTLTQIAGLYLIAEGIGSIIYSIDQRNPSQVGRLGRVAIGIYLMSQQIEI